MQAEASIIQLICCTIGAERGRAARGAPQLVGRSGEEAVLLRLAAACEARAPDRDRRPSIP